MKYEHEEINEALVALDTYNSDLNLVIDASKYSAHPLTNEGFAFMWAGVRATHGAAKGKICFEVKILEYLDVSHLPVDEPNPNVVRIGVSVESSSLQLGEDPLSYGYGGTGKASVNCQFKDFGGPFMAGDCILCAVNFDSDQVQIGFAKNGNFLGWAFKVNKHDLQGKALFPHILTKNCSFEVNFGQKNEPYFALPELLKDFTFIACVPVDERIGGTRPPKQRADCEMIMMCGLPGAGKSVWAAEYSAKNPEKKYNVLGTNNIIDKMKVMGLPRKRNYAGRWDVLIQMSTKCLNKMFEIGSKLRRNYILDQTNVYPTAQRRKMRNFEGFKRTAVVIVPTDEEYRKRCDKRDREEGKEVPDQAVLEMKANFKLPEIGDTFEDVIFTELKRDEAVKLVKKYNEEGKNAMGPPKKMFKPNDGGKGFDSSRGNFISNRGGSPRGFDNNGSRGRHGFGNRGTYDDGKDDFSSRSGFDSSRGGYGGRGGYMGERGGFEGGNDKFDGRRGGFSRRGYDGGRRGGFESGRGGFDGERRGGFEGSRGSFEGERRGGFEGSRGGFEGERRGGFEGSRGGFEGERRGRFEGGRGGFEGERRGGFEGGRGSFDGERRGGFEGGRGGGFDGERRGGFEGGRGGGFDSGRSGFEGGRGGGFDGGRRGGFEGGRGGGFDGGRRGGFEGGRGGGFDGGRRGGFEGGRGGGFDGGRRGGFEGVRGGFEGGSRGGYSYGRGGFGAGKGSFDSNRGGNSGGRGGFNGDRGSYGSGRGGFDNGRGTGNPRGGYERKRGYDGQGNDSGNYGYESDGFNEKSSGLPSQSDMMHSSMSSNASRGGSRGRGSISQGSYGSRDYTSENNANRQLAEGAKDYNAGLGGLFNSRNQSGSRGDSKHGGSFSSRDNSNSSGNNTGSNFGRNSSNNYGSGYGSYGDHSDKSQSDFKSGPDKYSSRDTSRPYTGGLSTTFKKEPSQSTKESSLDTSSRATRGTTRTRTGTRWSAETTQTYPQSQTTAVTASNSNYSSYIAPVKTLETVAASGRSQYDTFSAFTQNNPPPQAFPAAATPTAYGYQPPPPSLTSTITPPQWTGTHAPPPPPPVNPIGQVPPEQSQWTQYYQQTQPNQYFSQYYGQQAAATPPTYTSAYGSK